MATVHQETPKGNGTNGNGKNGNGDEFKDANVYVRAAIFLFRRGGVAVLILAFMGFIAYLYIDQVSIPGMRSEQQRADEAARQDRLLKDKESEARLSLLTQVSNVLIKIEQSQREWRLEAEGLHKQRADEAKMILTWEEKQQKCFDRMLESGDKQVEAHAAQIRTLQTIQSALEGVKKNGGAG